MKVTLLRFSIIFVAISFALYQILLFFELNASWIGPSLIACGLWEYTSSYFREVKQNDKN